MADLRLSFEPITTMSAWVNLCRKDGQRVEIYTVEGLCGRGVSVKPGTVWAKEKRRGTKTRGAPWGNGRRDLVAAGFTVGGFVKMERVVTLHARYWKISEQALIMGARKKGRDGLWVC